MEKLFIAMVEVINPFTNENEIFECKGTYEDMLDEVDKMVASCNHCGITVLKQVVVEI